MRVSRNDLKMMPLNELAFVLAKRISRRARIGWFDWSGSSYDMRVAMSRAARVWNRVNYGVRMSRNDAMAF